MFCVTGTMMSVEPATLIIDPGSSTICPPE